MKNKCKAAVAFALALLLLLVGVVPTAAQENADSLKQAESFLEGIVSYKMQQAGAKDVQQWMDGALAENAGGGAEWYVLALRQYGSYATQRYEAALLDYLSNNRVGAAASVQKFALALIACGSTDEYIAQAPDATIGQQGVMSRIFGLHLLNNGCISEQYTVQQLQQELLSMRKSDGGWSVTGTYSDVDVTAMAIQALAPYYAKDASVRAAVDAALVLLSARQKEAGDYASYGVNNAESTAQVLLALSSLGVDAARDERFIKNGNTLLDAIRPYARSDGGFCHTAGGSYSEMATAQTFCAMVAYLRMQNGLPPLYMLDARAPEGYRLPHNTPQTPSTSDAAPESHTAEQSSPVSDAKPQSTAADKATSAASLTASAVQDETAQSKAPQESAEVQLPSGTDRVPTIAQKKTAHGGYKLWVCLGIAVLGCGACVVLWVAKKRNYKNMLLIGLLCAAAIGIVLLTDFQTVSEHYDQQTASVENAIGTASICIRCDTIKTQAAAHIPSDGVILETGEFAIAQGDTVYDLLQRATAAAQIHIEATGGTDSAYIKGIGNIYEFDFGELSGWVYHVNGESPAVSCGAYQLRDGDVVEWLYTLDLGKDVA